VTGVVKLLQAHLAAGVGATLALERCCVPSGVNSGQADSSISVDIELSRFRDPSVRDGLTQPAERAASSRCGAVD
jgi:hypothetical protein